MKSKIKLKYLKRATLVALACQINAQSNNGSVEIDRPEKPNIVLIYADDLGWQDLKCYDIDDPTPYDTPYLDALADKGIKFTNGYAPSPRCSPSRGAIMSGRSSAAVTRTNVRGGLPFVSADTARLMEPFWKQQLEVKETSIPEALSSLGYLSGHSGKWHISGNGFPAPLDHGFDWSREDRGITARMPDMYSGFATSAPNDPYQLDENGFAYHQTTEDALDFLELATTGADTSNSPFFLYLANWLVHSPVQMRIESLLEKYALQMGYNYPLDGTENILPGKNPFYAAMVEALDYYTQKILIYLEETDDPRWPGHKLIDNTYVIFTSDNGGVDRYTDNAPLTGAKSWLEEGGIRVPFIVTGPGVPQGVVSDVMVNGLDLFPTILTLAGGKATFPLEGADLTNLLHTDPTDSSLVRGQDGSNRDTMYWHFPHISSRNYAAIRKNGWKLFKHFDPTVQTYRLFKLYNEDGTRNDIEEAVDVSSLQPALVEELSAELDEYLVSVNASLPFLWPDSPATLENKEFVPAIINQGYRGNRAWLTYETTDVAALDRVEIYYQKSDSDDEWFRAQDAVVSQPGRVDAIIPVNATAYALGLVDENNFLVLGDSIPYTYVPVSEQDILVGNWTFDDSSNIVEDTSGNKNNVSIEGGVATSTDGVIGNSVYFNGGVDKLIVPAAALDSISDEITYMLWVKGSSAQPIKDAILGAKDSSGNRVLTTHLPWSNSKVIWDAGNNGSEYDRMAYKANSEQYQDSWNHWTFTKNVTSGIMNIYANGTLVASESSKTADMSDIAFAYIGNSTSGNLGYNGLIDEVRLYNVELSAQEVSEIYSSQVIGLKAEWSFDSIVESSTTLDINGYNGISTNNVADNFEGIKGKAISFNGFDSSAMIPANAFGTVTDQISIAMWVDGNDNALPSRHALLRAFREDGTRALNIILPWSNSRVYWEAGGERINKSSTPSEYLEWNHWVFTKNATSGSMKIYLNGVLWHEETAKTNNIGGVAEVHLGSADGESFFYGGLLDDLIIYNTELTDEEILALYNSY